MIDLVSNLGSTYNSSKAGETKRLQMEAGSKDTARLKKACSDLEAIFIKQMLDSMRKTVNKSGFLDGGMAENIFE